MSNGAARQQLLGALRADEPEFWSILHELAQTPEPQRRAILRPHAEAGFVRERERVTIAQRARLDAALGALTRYEIGLELGILTPDDPVPADRADLRELFDNSEALLRYANAYLYFGVRFLGGRLFPPEWMTAPAPRNPPRRESNARPFALMTPPPTGDPAAAGSAVPGFLEFLNPANPDIEAAFSFLDDFIADNEEPTRLERWLHGLLPETDGAMESRFSAITRGMTAWATNRSNFYLSLQPPPEPVPDREAVPPEMAPGEERGPRPVGGWAVTNPVAARFGLSDIYWIARVLRADVSASASVTYTRPSWLHLLRSQAMRRGEAGVESALRKAEEVLRSVFDLTCDLIQNAIDLTSDRERRYFEPELFAELPSETKNWRDTFDEELDEVESQRNRRRYRDATLPPEENPPGNPGEGKKSADGWSKRIRTGEHPRNLIGIAFSGGGIRSATFNLGVLQALQELDLLRYADYLSTVSGGGFIGAWLIANVSRTAHWLGRLTNWDESVSHLRRYSNYLAPATGVLSADTWTMWAIWLRNAFLVQLTGATWLAVLLLVALVVKPLFLATGAGQGVWHTVPYAGVAAGVMALLVLLTLLYNLALARGAIGRRAFPAAWVQRLAVLPTWIASFLMASLFWADAKGKSALASDFAGMSLYSQFLRGAWRPWVGLLAFIWVSLFLIAAATLARHRIHALWISTVSVAALYLQFCAILWMFHRWSLDTDRFDWYAFVLGPTLVLAATTGSVILFIGFSGRNSGEWIREWWTRFGTWLAIYGVGYLAIATAAVFGPFWILSLVHVHWSIVSGTIAGWAGTIIGGLFAGKSSKTSGNGGRSKSPWLEVLARAAGLLFILGAVLIVSAALYALLVNIGTDYAVSTAYYWEALRDIPWQTSAAALAVALACGVLFSWAFEINIFGLNQFYRNRLVRCYLGATRWAPGLRRPQPFTGFDGQDDMRLGNLRGYRGPFPILNCALNLGGSSDLALHTRRSASFFMTPLRCGADRPRVGYAPTRLGEREFAGGVMLGQAVAISGAAASPNMGYNTSPLVAFLLTMFNVRLGWWFPNPGRRGWHLRGLRFSLRYMIKELFGLADETNMFINVSDGGHFENLGVYELVRRRCKVIIASDAECDESLQFGSLGNLIRICETDFGAKIDIDVRSIRTQKEEHSLAHCTVGRITYSNGSFGYLLYLKSSVTGDESVSIAQYRSAHPSFPHETTADQFFSEDQFESYRSLGYHVVRHALRGIQPGSHPVNIAEKLYDVWSPAGFTNESFLRHTKTLDQVWERFRRSPGLHAFLSELMGNGAPAAAAMPVTEEVCAGVELIQLMENVFLDLRLDDFWDHPDNRGWAMLFMSWARSPLFRGIWIHTRRTFGIRFEYFCEERLGLPRDHPIVRV